MAQQKKQTSATTPLPLSPASTYLRSIAGVDQRWNGSFPGCMSWVRLPSRSHGHCSFPATDAAEVRELQAWFTSLEIGFAERWDD